MDQAAGMLSVVEVCRSEPRNIGLIYLNYHHPSWHDVICDAPYPVPCFSSFGD